MKGHGRFTKPVKVKQVGPRNKGPRSVSGSAPPKVHGGGSRLNKAFGMGKRKV